MADLIRIRVQVKVGFREAGKRGIIFSLPEPGDTWANILLDGEDAPNLWQWRCLEILGPDTRKSKGEEGKGEPLPELDRLRAFEAAALKAFDRLDRCVVYGPADAVRDLVEKARALRVEPLGKTLGGPAGLRSIEQAAREYVAAQRALMEAGDPILQKEMSEDELDNRAAAEDAAWTNLCVAVDGWTPDAQGSEARSAPESPRGSNPENSRGPAGGPHG